MAKQKASKKQSDAKWEAEFLKTGAGKLCIINLLIALALIIAQVAGSFAGFDLVTQNVFSMLNTFFCAVGLAILLTAYCYNGPSRKDIKK